MGHFDFSSYFAIDLGTTSTSIFSRKKGIVLRESSVVTVKDDSNRRILSAGNDAKQMIGKTPENVLTVKPLRDGVVADIDIAPRMLKYFIKKISTGDLIMKLTIVVCCPTGIT